MSPEALGQRLRALEEARRLAMLAGDVAALEGLCSKALAYTHSRGELDLGDAYLAKVASGHFSYHALAFEIEEVIGLGQGGAVRGVMLGEVDAGAERRRLHCRYLAIWERDADSGTDTGTHTGTDTGTGGEWRLRAYQPTPVLAG